MSDYVECKWVDHPKAEGYPLAFFEGLEAQRFYEHNKRLETLEKDIATLRDSIVQLTQVLREHFEKTKPSELQDE